MCAPRRLQADDLGRNNNSILSRAGGDDAAADTGLARRIAVAYERIISELGPDHAVTLDGCLSSDEVLAHVAAAMRERGLLPS